MDALERIEQQIRRHELIEPRGAVLCLVSGGPDSTCLFHALRLLGYRASVTLADGLARTAAWFAGALADPTLAAVEAHAASGSE
jgi:hypothetical protein